MWVDSPKKFLLKNVEKQSNAALCGVPGHFPQSGDIWGFEGTILKNIFVNTFRSGRRITNQSTNF